MKLQRFIPFVVIAVLVGALAYAQVGLRPKQKQDTGEQMRSQVSTPGNRLEDFRRLDVEIELVNGAEVTLVMINQDDEDPRAVLRRGDRPEQEEATGQEALDQTEAVVGAIPALPTNEPLKLIQAVLDQLAVAQADVREFEFEYILANGESGAVELQVKDREDADLD